MTLEERLRLKIEVTESTIKSAKKSAVLSYQARETVFSEFSFPNVVEKCR